MSKHSRISSIITMSNQTSLNTHQGLLYKRGRFNKNWKERWFILYDDFSLKYYESQSKAAESEMLGNDKYVLGAINILDIEFIEVALIDDTVIASLPKYVNVLEDVKQDSANKMGGNNENGCIDNKRGYIIHLVFHERTYILSANTLQDFQKWLTLFYHPVYEGILVESKGWIQGTVRSYKKPSYKQRYFVLTEYQQIRVYSDDQRQRPIDSTSGFEVMNLRDVHSFNIENIAAKKSPTEFLLEFNGSKKKQILCFETKELLRFWCRALSEKLNLKTAGKVGRKSIFGRSEYVKREMTFYSDNEAEEEEEEDPHLISTQVSNVMRSSYFSPKKGDKPDNLFLNPEEEGKVSDDVVSNKLDTKSHLEHSIELLTDSENATTTQPGDGGNGVDQTPGNSHGADLNTTSAGNNGKANMDTIPFTKPSLMTQLSDLDL